MFAEPICLVQVKWTKHLAKGDQLNNQWPFMITLSKNTVKIIFILLCVCSNNLN